MNNYRKDMSEVARESGWTVRRFAPLVVGTIIAATVLGFALNSLGIIGRTVVEREVFENSYQRSTSLQERIAVERATLAEIERKLRSPDLDPSIRANLEAQASASRIRLSTAEGLQ